VDTLQARPEVSRVQTHLPQLLLIALASFARSEAFSQETLPELVRRVKPSIVAIVTYDAKCDALTTGNGFFIRPGQVVTNLHVIRGALRTDVKTLDGKGRVYQVAGLLADDEESDLAQAQLRRSAKQVG